MRKAMNRDDYLMRAHEFAHRGADLPQAKLNPDDVKAIRDAVAKREDLRAYIRESLSNHALAAKFGVHVRTVDKVIQFGSWRHIP